MDHREKGHSENQWICQENIQISPALYFNEHVHLVPVFFSPTLSDDQFCTKYLIKIANSYCNTALIPKVQTKKVWVYTLAFAFIKWAT